MGKAAFGFATGLVSLVGVLVSGYLVNVHIGVKVGESAGGLCNLGATVNCSAAAASTYSELAGIPIAALGMGWYIAVIVMVGLQLSRGGPTTSATSIPALIQSFFSLSVVYSLFLAVVSFFVLPAVCPFCVVLYIVNLLGLVFATLWSGSNPLSTLREQLGALGQVLAGPSTLGFLATAVVATVGLTAYSRAAVLDRAGEVEVPQERVAVDPSALSASHAPALGPRSASVSLVLFSDFQCPYCAKFAETVRYLEETFGSKLRVEFRHFPLSFHQNAPLAARYSMCAHAQGRFWDFHDRLFEDQEGLVNPDGLKRTAEELGLDLGALQTCLADPEIGNLVAQDRALGEKIGVESTPSFFLNGTLYLGAQPLDAMTRIIETELSRSERVAAKPDKEATAP